MLTECVGNCRSVDEIHSIAWSNLKLARQKHDLFFLSCPSFLIQKMFALTLIPSWKHHFIMTQWIIRWKPWTMIGGLTIVWKASLLWVEIRLLCETFFLSKRTIWNFPLCITNRNKMEITVKWCFLLLCLYFSTFHVLIHSLTHPQNKRIFMWVKPGKYLLPLPNTE